MLQISSILITLAGLVGLFSILYQGKQFLSPFWVKRIGDKNAKIVGAIFSAAMAIFGVVVLISSLRL